MGEPLVKKIKKIWGGGGYPLVIFFWGGYPLVILGGGVGRSPGNSLGGGGGGVIC